MFPPRGSASLLPESDVEITSQQDQSLCGVTAKDLPDGMTLQ